MAGLTPKNACGFLQFLKEKVPEGRNKIRANTIYGVRSSFSGTMHIHTKDVRPQDSRCTIITDVTGCAVLMNNCITNPVILNGEPLMGQAILHNKDIISISGSEFMYINDWDPKKFEATHISKERFSRRQETSTISDDMSVSNRCDKESAIVSGRKTATEEGFHRPIAKSKSARIESNNAFEAPSKLKHTFSKNLYADMATQKNCHTLKSILKKRKEPGAKLNEFGDAEAQGTTCVQGATATLQSPRISPKQPKLGRHVWFEDLRYTFKLFLLHTPHTDTSVFIVQRSKGLPVSAASNIKQLATKCLSQKLKVIHMNNSDKHKCILNKESQGSKLHSYSTIETVDDNCKRVLRCHVNHAILGTLACGASGNKTIEPESTGTEAKNKTSRHKLRGLRAESNNHQYLLSKAENITIYPIIIRRVSTRSNGRNPLFSKTTETAFESKTMEPVKRRPSLVTTSQIKTI